MPDVARNYSELVDRTRWYVYLRWFLLLLVIVPSLIASYIDVGWGDRFLRDLLFCVVALGSNTVFHILTHTLKKRSSIRNLAFIIVMADVALVSFFIHTKGGIESRSSILYILPMVAAAAILGRRGMYTATALSVIGFTFIILGGYFQFLGAPLSMFTPQLDRDPGYVANTIIFFDLVILVIAVAIDYMTRLLITREEQTRRALVNMRAAQVIAKTGGWDYDVSSRTITFSEELFSVMNGILSSRTIPADDFIELVHRDDRTLVRRKFLGAIRRRTGFSFKHRVYSLDGAIRHIRLDGKPVADKSGSVHLVLGSARDITDEAALQKARNDFVALASHQLRTPATIVKQYIGMLRDGFIGPMSDDQKAMLDIAYTTNERQIKIVNDLLNVARIDANSYKITRKKTDLRELLSEIVRDQKAKFEGKDQTLTLTGKSAPMLANIDADGLRMAIDNLLDNAYKYTPPGKSIRIGLNKQAKHALIAIHDRGIGIAKNDLPKMFKLFSRVENPLTLQQEGTGLGLYWADHIVRLHRGKITVASEVGKGTTFTISLPI